MRYPSAIAPGTETTAFGVVVPDLPGWGYFGRGHGRRRGSRRRLDRCCR